MIPEPAEFTEVPVRTADRPAESPIGAPLRAARERQGLTLEIVARGLHITPKFIHALEAGNLRALPADVIARGFLRQYADLLGLDPVPLLRAFARERTRLPRTAPTTPWARPGDRRSWEWVTPRRLGVVAGSLVLASVLLYFASAVRTYVRAPHLTLLEPPYDIEVRETSLTVRGETDPTAELTINGERIAVREDGIFEETLALGRGVNTIRFVATSLGGRETTVTRGVLVRGP